MPLYEYRCDACETTFERIQKFSDPPVAECPTCGGPVHKLVSSPAIQFKGTGWYITDYAKSGKDSKSEKSERSDKSTKTEAAKSADTAGKTDSSTGTSASSASTGSDTAKAEAPKSESSKPATAPK